MELILDQALQKSIAALTYGELKQAGRYYSAILKSNPKHPDANHSMGFLAIGLGKVSGSLALFNTALEANPCIPQYWLRHINALIELDQLDIDKEISDQTKSKAIKRNECEQVAKGSQKMVTIAKGQTSKKILERAVDLRDTGKYIEAINILTQGISQFPTDPNLRAGLSHCYILNNNINEAYRHLNEAKEIDPTIAQVGWNEARLLLKDKKPHKALTIGKKTNKAFPDDIEGMTVLASCLRICGYNNESLKFLNAALKLKPDYAEALMNRGLINLEQKDIASGLIDLEKASTKTPY